MTPEQFCYWLQGLMEISDPETLSAKELLIIKDHLQLVFDKQTPDRDLDKEIREAAESAKDLLRKNTWRNPNDPFRPICTSYTDFPPYKKPEMFGTFND